MRRAPRTMRRQRRTPRTAAVLVTALLLGFTAYASADAFKLAKAFENTPAENATALLDEIVVPASLESEKAPLPEDPEPRELKPVEASATRHHAQNSLPYGGALVAVEATALLVGGATLVVMVITKMKTRIALAQYEKEELDPIMESLLYSDMDYAAI